MKGAKKRGGTRYKKISLSLPKKQYLILNAIAMDDNRKLNRLIKAIIDEKLSQATVVELTSYLSREERDEEEEHFEETSVGD